MILKTVYFVRHGESQQNIGHATYLGEASRLTAKGIEQARFIAARCARLPIDVLIASTAVRAQETAQYISERTGKPIEIQGLFTERKEPSEMLGMLTDDPAMRELESAWALTFMEEGTRVSDGENFEMLKKRVIQALDHLDSRSEENILVVSHGYFLHMLIALIVFGRELTAREFSHAAWAVWMDNTGLTRIELRDQAFRRIDGKHHRDWVLRVWNDHAHLG